MPPFPGQLVHFGKYHGTGNDFVLLDWPHAVLPTPAHAIHLCDRRAGVGADGLLLLVPPTSPEAASRMVLFNPDGSRPEMCGNGLRCAAVHATIGRQLPPTFMIETDAGPRACQVLSPGNPASVRVAMGTIPKPNIFTVDQASIHHVSVGNPHAVTLANIPLDRRQALIDSISAHTRFPHGVNVGFPTSISTNAFDLHVHERGAGWTQACGTGACAATVALWFAGQLQSPRDVHVRLPGGLLTIDYDPATTEAWLTGEVTRVFEGLIPWPDTI